MERKRIEVLTYVKRASMLHACGMPSTPGMLLDPSSINSHHSEKYFIHIDFPVSSSDRLSRPTHPLSHQTENSNRRDEQNQIVELN